VAALEEALSSGAGTGPLCEALEEIIAVTGGKGNLSARLAALGFGGGEQYGALARTLASAGALAALVGALEAHFADPFVCECGTLALRNVTSAAADVAAAAADAHAVRALTRALVHHAEDSIVVEGACGALYNVAGGLKDGAAAGALFERAIPHIVAAKMAHKGARKHALALLERLGRDEHGSLALARAAQNGGKDCSIV